jgi:hypothetical protein
MSESIAAVTGPHVLIARQYLRAVYPAAMASAEHEPDRPLPQLGSGVNAYT